MELDVEGDVGDSERDIGAEADGAVYDTVRALHVDVVTRVEGNHLEAVPNVFGDGADLRARVQNALFFAGVVYPHRESLHVGAVVSDYEMVGRAVREELSNEVSALYEDRRLLVFVGQGLNEGRLDGDLLGRNLLTNPFAHVRRHRQKLAKLHLDRLFQNPVQELRGQRFVFDGGHVAHLRSSVRCARLIDLRGIWRERRRDSGDWWDDRRCGVLRCRRLPRLGGWLSSLLFGFNALGVTSRTRAKSSAPREVVFLLVELEDGRLNLFEALRRVGCHHRQSLNLIIKSFQLLILLGDLLNAASGLLRHVDSVHRSDGNGGNGCRDLVEEVVAGGLRLNRVHRRCRVGARHHLQCSLVKRNVARPGDLPTVLHGDLEGLRVASDEPRSFVVSEGRAATASHASTVWFSTVPTGFKISAILALRGRLGLSESVNLRREVLNL